MTTEVECVKAKGSEEPEKITMRGRQPVCSVIPVENRQSSLALLLERSDEPEVIKVKTQNVLTEKER